MPNEIKYILFIAISLFYISCSKEPVKVEVVINQDSLDRVKRINDSLAILKKIEDADNKWEEITYSKVVIKSRKQLDSVLKDVRSKETPNRLKIFITLNRRESRLIKMGDTLVLPNKYVEDVLAYSMFPHYFPEADTLEKLIIVSNEYQSYACYEKGQLVRFAACNTGKEKTPTYPGRYSLVWRDRIRKSSLDSTWVLPYTFNFHRYAGNAFHQFSMPGYAASHSCVRQFMSDAKWLFEWGSQAKYENRQPIPNSGTPVIILGIPDYKNKKGGAWVHLKSNRERPIDFKFEPMGVEEALIPISQIPEVVRDWIPNRDRYLYAEDSLRARGIIASNVKITPSINFNKLRREKKEKARQDSIKKFHQAENDKTDIKLIESNLLELEGAAKDTTSEKKK